MGLINTYLKAIRQMQCSCWDTVMEERLLQTLDVSQFKDHNSLNYFDNFVFCQLY